ncbi:MAG: hypothetical protein JW820_03910 [Spirochaetales bacterium]|nr:hypothetical protein [Spirochaetales bacterium]
MGVYAGIDEAGYGPILGPLVIVRSVFRVESMEPGGAPPCLWGLLPQLLCRRIRETGSEGTRSRTRTLSLDCGRIPINDSKLLYSLAAGLQHLERGVLALLPGPYDPPADAAELLDRLAFDPDSRLATLPWYAEAAGETRLPVQASAAELPVLREAFRRESAGAGLRAEELSAAVVFEDRFNRLVGETRSKALCAWRFVAGHLAALWERFGEQGPYVVVDRQGGRRAYGPLLAGLFARTRVEILAEEPEVSRYRLTGPGRRMQLEFRVQAEAAHLPVALASMAAKYVRELLMLRFQRYWTRLAPEVRPTAGYFADGTRFLREIEPHLKRLGVPRELLARRC